MAIMLRTGTFILFLLAAISACDHQRDSDRIGSQSSPSAAGAVDLSASASNAPSPSNAYFLDPVQLSETISKAEAGDKLAMQKLYHYYTVADDDGTEQGLLWLKRLAAAGDEDARVNLAEWCTENPSREFKACTDNDSDERPSPRPG
jgi:hypothetical protein